MGDLAAHLGISRQLVSLVLNDAPGASAETRRRVRAAAAELGYRPHMAARALRQGGSTRLGVVFAPAHATEPDIVERIYPAAEREGYTVLLSAIAPTRSTDDAVDELLGHRCAAVIVIGSSRSTAQLRDLTVRVGVPVVVIGAGSRNAVFDVVKSAGDAGIALAVRHVVELGHRDIVYVNPAGMPAARLRRSGYLRTMRLFDLPPRVIDAPGDYTEEAGASAARQLLAGARLPTALIAGNDQAAIGVLQVLARAGVRIPDEVSLTGFDDTRFARLSSVDLTTVRQDPGDMGEAAVKAAVRRIADAALKATQFITTPRLIVRSSTSAPRSR
jgi:DNA-binding LacI/PurR family transcriptional regulator